VVFIYRIWYKNKKSEILVVSRIYVYPFLSFSSKQISSVQKKSADLGQEEIVQLCMKNMKWVEDLFEKFGELLNRVQQKCS